MIRMNNYNSAIVKHKQNIHYCCNNMSFSGQDKLLSVRKAGQFICAQFIVTSPVLGLQGKDALASRTWRK